MKKWITYLILTLFAASALFKAESDCHSLPSEPEKTVSFSYLPGEHQAIFGHSLLTSSGLFTSSIANTHNPGNETLTKQFKSRKYQKTANMSQLLIKNKQLNTSIIESCFHFVSSTCGNLPRLAMLERLEI